MSSNPIRALMRKHLPDRQGPSDAVRAALRAAFPPEHDGASSAPAVGGNDSENEKAVGGGKSTTFDPNAARNLDRAEVKFEKRAREIAKLDKKLARKDLSKEARTALKKKKTRKENSRDTWKCKLDTRKAAGEKK